MAGKITKYILVVALLAIMSVTSGCGAAGYAKAALQIYKHNEESAKNSSAEAEKPVNWQRVSIPMGVVYPKKLYMDMPFELEQETHDSEGIKELPKGKFNMYHDRRCSILIYHAKLEDDQKFPWTAQYVSDCLRNVKDSKATKKTERKANDDQPLICIEGQAVGGKSGRSYRFQMVGAQRDRDVWMVLFLYETDDQEMADLANKTMESIKIH